MHSTITVALLVMTSTLPVLADQVAPVPQSQLQQKLAEIRLFRERQFYRNRVAVVPFRNETRKAGAEQNFTEETVDIFKSRNFQVVSQHEIEAALEGRVKGTQLSEEELARLAEKLKVETIVLGTVKQYEAKRKFGLPLPTMWIATHANVALEGAVYRRSANRIVWQESAKHHDKELVGGAMTSRNEARARTGREALEKLFDGYFESKSSSKQ
jgi:hypothetical protein